ncbi:MAG: SGNH/GDSL hydrolase family protein [Phycisphaerae bacterium]
MTEKPTQVATPVATTKPRRRWLVGLGVLAGLVVVAEILLRLIFGFGSPVLTQLDNACGYMFVPDQHLYRLFAHNDINHEGMRCEDFLMPKPKGVYRAYFIGDSITYGTTHVDQPLIFTSRLQHLLHPAGAHNVQVLNMSQGGWGPQNEIGYLMSRGTFDANVVLLVLNTGDPGEEFAHLQPGDINYPLHRPPTAIGEVWSRYVRPRLFHETIAGDAGTTLPAPEVVEKHEAINLAVIDKGRQFVEKSGAVFAIVYVPFAGWKRDVIETSEKVIGDWAASMNVPFIDTAPAMEKEDAGKLTMDGMHLKPYGNEVVAHEIQRQWGVIDAAVAAASSQPATQK